MRRKKFKFPLRAIIIVTLILLSIASLLFLFIRFLVALDYFKIKEVEYSGLFGERVQKEKSDYIGESIFKIDLKKASRRLSVLFPEYKSIIVKRMLPDRVIINFVPRRAVAKIKLSEFFYIDKEGVLFLPVEQKEDKSHLPLIVGLETKIVNPRSGVRCNNSVLLKTLEFIDNFNRDADLNTKLKIKNINLTNINDVFLFTTSDCRINLGRVDSLDKKLLILQKLLSKIDHEVDKTKYIDLRFREPVVKYN